MKGDTSKWGKMASDKKEIQDTIVSSLSTLESKPDYSEFIRRIEGSKPIEGLTPLGFVRWLFEPLTSLETSIPKDDDLDGGGADSVMEKQKPSPLKGFNREQVISICNLHGLRTLDQLLQLIDRLQQANKGVLNQPS